MVSNRQELLERVLSLYDPYYNLEQCEAEEAPMAAKAIFHEHATGYVMLKVAETWAADKHEYVYFFSLPKLTVADYDACLAKARALGEPLVNPVKGHMSTNIVAVFLCDEVEQAAVQKLEKCRIRKSFQFSLRGWMEVQTAVVDLGNQTVASNAAGRATAEFLKNVFPQQVKRRKWGRR